MHELIRIGRTWNMEKVMLTVLKGTRHIIYSSNY